MKKAGRGAWLVLLVCTFALMAVTFPSGALAATCTVGDLSKGYWKTVVGPNQGKCIIPGPPANSSPWPTDPDQLPSGNSSRAYRIEGKYKLSASISADGGWSIPPARPECITGYAEAYATAMSARYQSWVPEPQPACCHTTYTATGTLCTVHWTDSRYGGSDIYNYIRCFEYAFLLEEWVWTNKECEKEEPPPAPTNTPNLDPGDPTCSQAPLD